MDRQHRQREPGHARRQHRERIAGRGFPSRVNDLRGRTATGFRSRQTAHPVCDFHSGYKQTRLAVDESSPPIADGRICTLLRVFAARSNWPDSEAIAKLCLAGLGKSQTSKIEDVRLAIGSMAVTPLRLRRTEETSAGPGVESRIGWRTRQAMERGCSIDDIRSSAAYRLRVAGDLAEGVYRRLFR